jgi:hypothetical protein
VCGGRKVAMAGTSRVVRGTRRADLKRAASGVGGRALRAGGTGRSPRRGEGENHEGEGPPCDAPHQYRSATRGAVLWRRFISDPSCDPKQNWGRL